MRRGSSTLSTIFLLLSLSQLRNPLVVATIESFVVMTALVGAGVALQPFPSGHLRTSMRHLLPLSRSPALCGIPHMALTSTLTLKAGSTNVAYECRKIRVSKRHSTFPTVFKPAARDVNTLSANLRIHESEDRTSEDTIFALSTGNAGPAGVAVIRISGKNASNVLQAITAVPSTERGSNGVSGATRKERALPPPRHAVVRRLYDPANGDLLDEALVLWMPGPRSFTGEDTVELHTHGSRAVINGVLDALGSMAPSRVRMAERGEFTQRAYGNGRMDLTGVEGLADLLAADTSAQRKQALRQMGGGLRDMYESWREELKVCLAHAEAVIDFGDDERLLRVLMGLDRAVRPRRPEGQPIVFSGRCRRVSPARFLVELSTDKPRRKGTSELFGSPSSAQSPMLPTGSRRQEDVGGDSAFAAIFPRVTKLAAEMKMHLRDGRRGEIVRSGVRVAIVGPPNAGKSSLLNLLASRPAAIVSPVAGTTRDVVEVQMDLAGLPVTLSDTAGLREATEDEIEREGMRRAREAVDNSQLVIFVFDGSDGVGAMELLRKLREESDKGTAEAADGHRERVGGFSGTDDTPAALDHAIIVANKADLLQAEGRIDDTLDPLAGAAAYVGSSWPGQTAGAASRERQRGEGTDRGLQEKPARIWRISCRTRQGVDDFVNHLEEEVAARFQITGDDESPLITRRRHREHVEACLGALKASQEASLPLDLAAEELRIASCELGRITGAVGVEELLDVIFRDFCIGK